MPNYPWTARDASGKPVTEQVTAEAQKLFGEVEAWLISGREEELLAHCRHSLRRA